LGQRFEGLSDDKDLDVLGEGLESAGEKEPSMLMSHSSSNSTLSSLLAMCAKLWSKTAWLRLNTVLIYMGVPVGRM
jgi:hypothetical protein